jgi:hypothetical protein
MYGKNVRENVDYDIIIKQYFPRAHTKEREELETSLFAEGASNNPKSGQHMNGPWKLL